MFVMNLIGAMEFYIRARKSLNADVYIKLMNGGLGAYFMEKIMG